MPNDNQDRSELEPTSFDDFDQRMDEENARLMQEITGQNAGQNPTDAQRPQSPDEQFAHLGQQKAKEIIANMWRGSHEAIATMGDSQRHIVNSMEQHMRDTAEAAGLNYEKVYQELSGRERAERMNLFKMAKKGEQYIINGEDDKPYRFQVGNKTGDQIELIDIDHSGVAKDPQNNSPLERFGMDEKSFLEYAKTKWDHPQHTPHEYYDIYVPNVSLIKDMEKQATGSTKPFIKLINSDPATFAALGIPVPVGTAKYELVSANGKENKVTLHDNSKPRSESVTIKLTTLLDYIKLPEKEYKPGAGGGAGKEQKEQKYEYQKGEVVEFNSLDQNQNEQKLEGEIIGFANGNYNIKCFDNLRNKTFVKKNIRPDAIIGRV